ncbi:MAG: hypothetical protein LBM62_00510 [Mediterranea sp.]|jgi:hypothetical protein|nr:hypothetical protein [Mediterranea sp.]
MDIGKFIAQFFYRIRYSIVWGTFIVTALVVYFTQFLPFSYTVEGSIYAGVTNATSIDGSSINVTAVNSTFENLVNLAKSRSTLEKTSIKLLAIALTYGEEWKDNSYIQAKHYRQLLQATPREVLTLVDRDSVNLTLEQLQKYRKEDRNNYVYQMFHLTMPFFSAKALNSVEIKRAGNSDILNITYTSPDPGMTQKTVEIIISELQEAYEILRFKSTNDVIAYYEEQVRLAKEELNDMEDDLTAYNVSQQIINYNEETKALAITRYAVEDRLELAHRTYEAAIAIRQELEGSMDIRGKIMRDNTNFLQQLDKISILNEEIIKQEIFASDKSLANNEKLKKDREALQKAEENIGLISDELNQMNFTKEGVGLDDMILEWLHAIIDETKSAAEVKVLDERIQDILRQFAHMSPIGTQVSRKERAVGIAETNYKTQIEGLSDAHLRQKNIEMSTSNLQTIAPPSYPLTDNGRQRVLYIVIAFLGSLVFIITFHLIIELMDRTLRDPVRSKRLTGLPVVAAFNGTSNLKFRGYLKACNRTAAAYCCRNLNQYIQTERPTVINLLSMEPGEGKSFLARYFVQYWATEGLRVRIVSHSVDYTVTDSAYIQAQQLSDFWVLNEAEQKPDIILVEYPATHTATVPLTVLQKADANLFIANAERLWRDSDDTTLEPIRKALADTPFYLYLNNASRDVVESFTGELPPYTPIHSFFSRLSQLGLTSRKVSIR